MLISLNIQSEKQQQQQQKMELRETEKFMLLQVSNSAEL